MSELSIQNLSYEIDNKTLLKQVTVNFRSAAVNMLLGPNGSGKTLTFRCILGLTQPSDGHVRYNDIDLSKLSKRELSRLISWVPCHSEVSFAFTVKQVALMGRFPHNLGMIRKIDYDSVTTSLNMLRITHLKDRIYQTLSQGEQMKVQIARAICTGTPIMIFDEICANLDPKNKFEILALLKDLAHDHKKTIVISHHDLHTVMQYADYVTFLKSGSLMDHGHISDHFTAENIKKTFDVDANLIDFAGRSLINIFP